MSSRDFIELSPIAQKHLGVPGTMLVRSKSDRTATTICNATVFNSNGTMIWSGDLDIKVSKDHLLSLQKEMGKIFILFESDGFHVDRAPTLAYLKRNAQVIVEAGTIFYSEHFAEWMQM